MAEKDQSVALRNQSGKALKEAEALVIETPEEYAGASELLVRIKTAVKIITEARDKVLGPILLAEKEERARWKPVLDEASIAEGTTKRKMLDYVAETDRKARAEEAKIRKDMEDGKIKKPETAVRKAEAIERPPEQVKTFTGQSQVRTVRTMKIVDENLIPREYLVPDLVAIRKAVLGFTLPDGTKTVPIDVPGVQVVEEKTISGITRS